MQFDCRTCLNFQLRNLIIKIRFFLVIHWLHLLKKISSRILVQTHTRLFSEFLLYYHTVYMAVRCYLEKIRGLLPPY